MKKEICTVYFSHQLKDSEHGTFEENLLNASLQVAAIVEAFAGKVCVLADWITIGSVFKAQGKLDVNSGLFERYREMCLKLDCHQVTMCDMFLMAGPHLSSGMSRELAAANASGKHVVDAVGLSIDDVIVRLGFAVNLALNGHGGPEDPVSPVETLQEGEPYFVLRAQDVLAPDIVREWVHAARIEGVHHEKVSQARAVADRMEDWQVAHGRRLPD